MRNIKKDVPLEEEVQENIDELEEVIESDEEVTEEVAKMLKDARDKVVRDAEKSLGNSQVEALKAVDNLMKGIADTAKKHTKVAESAESSIDVDAISKGIDELYNKSRNSFSFSISSTKDLDTFAKKAVSESGSLEGDVIEPQRVPEITRDPVRSVFVESICDVAPMSSESLSYVEVVNESGNPAYTEELAEIPEKDYEFKEFKAHLRKVGVVNKHSVELLKDAPQLVNYIKSLLREDLNLEVDKLLLNGTGDSAKSIIGILDVASELNASAIGSKRVADANLYDVIRVAITKIATSGKGKFSATHILLNPEDADALDLTKDDSGNYVLPPFRSADGSLIKGARVLENTGITAGTFIVGDFSKYHIGKKGDVEIEMTNSDGDDFRKDILTIKLRKRIASYARTNDSGAFWTGNISTVIGILKSS